MDHVWGVRPCAISSHNGRFYYSCTCGAVSQCWESHALAERMAAAHVPSGN